MLKSILLVLDGQGVDHGSIDLGIRWSLEFDALLVGLGVIDESLVSPAEPVPLGAGQAKHDLDQARLHERQRSIGGALSAIAVRCAHAQAGFKPLECIGRPADGIAVEAQRFDLILMPRQLDKQEKSVEWEVSETLRTILRASPRPLVAVPDQLPDGNAVVVAYDGSLQAARTLYAFVASGLMAKHPVHVVSIGDEPLAAARQGNLAVEFLAAHGVRATLSAESSVDPAGQIMAVARDMNAGLVVLGAYGQTRIHEFFLGSVTSTMLAKCPIPLFLFH